MQKKNVLTGVLLSILGPLGMLYISSTSFLCFLIINIFIALISYIFKITSGGTDIWLFLYFITTIVGIFWSFNIITENNNRIDSSKPALAKNEEINIGFSNVSNAIATFLIALFFSCIFYAVCSLTNLFNDSNHFTQIIVSLVVFWFFLIFSIVKNLKSEV